MSNNGQSAKRASFSGKIGYVLAVAGSAVGLGNIWRFPYLAAKYGGGIFLLVYLILTVSFGYVLIMSETALGRMTRKSPVGAFQTFGKTKSFKIGGWLNAIIPMLIVPYYSSIGGWVIKYLAVFERKCADCCTGRIFYRIYFRFFSGRSMVHRVFYSCILRYPGRS